MEAMILGLSTFTYGWAMENRPVASMDERALLAESLRHGLTCVQIGDNLPLHTFSDERLTQLRETASKDKIRVEVGARMLTGSHLETYIRICEVLDSRLLRFIIDGNGYEPSLQTITSIITDVEPELKRRNIVLGIENHDRLGARALATLMDHVGGRHVGICLDTTNSLGSGEGIEYVAGLLAPYTVNFHIKDFKVTRLSYKMGFTVAGARLGEGLLNIPMLMDMILPYGRCETAIFEQWVPPEAQYEASVKKEKEWADAGIAYLKQLKWFNTEYAD
jgi:sugar phosphate isomerase/epimerase